LKLNGVHPEGYRGKYGWRNFIPTFFSRKNSAGNKYNRAAQYKYNRADHTSTMVTFKDVIVPRKRYAIHTEVFNLRIPRIDMFQFLTLILVIVFVVAVFFSTMHYFSTQEDMDYRQMLRHQVLYNVNNALVPYDSQVKDILYKLNEHDMYIQVMMRGHHVKEVQKRYEDIQSGKTIIK